MCAARYQYSSGEVWCSQSFETGEICVCEHASERVRDDVNRSTRARSERQASASVCSEAGVCVQRSGKAEEATDKNARCLLPSPASVDRRRYHTVSAPAASHHRQIRRARGAIGARERSGGIGRAACFSRARGRPARPLHGLLPVHKRQLWQHNHDPCGVRERGERPRALRHERCRACLVVLLSAILCNKSWQPGV